MEKEIEKLFDALEEAMRERQDQLIDESEDSNIKNLAFSETEYEVKFGNGSLYLYVTFNYEYEFNEDLTTKKVTKRITDFNDVEYIASDVLYEVDELITKHLKTNYDTYDEDNR